MGMLCPWGRTGREKRRGSICKQMRENMAVKRNRQTLTEVWYRLLWFCFLDHLPDTQGCAGLKMIPRCLADVHQSHGTRQPADEKCSSPHWTQPVTQEKWLNTSHSPKDQTDFRLLSLWSLATVTKQEGLSSIRLLHMLKLIALAFYQSDNNLKSLEGDVFF